MRSLIAGLIALCVLAPAKSGCVGRAVAVDRSRFRRRRAALDQPLSRAPAARRRAGHPAGRQPLRRLREPGARRHLCRLPGRRADRNPARRRGNRRTFAGHAGTRPLGGHARHRLFRLAQLASSAAALCLPHAALRRAERPLHQRQDGDAGAVRGAAGAQHVRAREQAPASRQGVRRPAAEVDAGAERGIARRAVGLLFRHRQLRPGDAHRRHAAAGGRITTTPTG